MFSFFNTNTLLKQRIHCSHCKLVHGKAALRFHALRQRCPSTFALHNIICRSSSSNRVDISPQALNEQHLCESADDFCIYLLTKHQFQDHFSGWVSPCPLPRTQLEHDAYGQMPCNPSSSVSTSLNAHTICSMHGPYSQPEADRGGGGGAGHGADLPGSSLSGWTTFQTWVFSGAVTRTLTVETGAKYQIPHQKAELCLFYTNILYISYCYTNHILSCYCIMSCLIRHRMHERKLRSTTSYELQVTKERKLWSLRMPLLRAADVPSKS